MAGKQKPSDALAELLTVASPEALADLILQLVIERPDVRRECFDFLKTHVSLSDKLEKRSASEIILALWAELAPDLRDLDDYGGGDYAIEDHVAELLDQIREQLLSKKVESDYRSEILGSVLPYIKSGNAGMDDMLYEVAYAACYDNADLCRLAESFEAMQGEWMNCACFSPTGPKNRAIVRYIWRFKAKLVDLKRRQRFISWKESASYAYKLEMILEDLKSGVNDPETGVELVAAFYRADGAVFEQCDDSSGNVGDVFRFDAKQIFVSYASRCQDKEWLGELVFNLNRENDYGVRDVLVDCASEYLPETVIRHLINRFQDAATGTV